MFDLSGYNCLVTGGSGHLGRAMVRELCEAGATVFAAGRDIGAVEALSEDCIELRGRMIPISLDVTSESSVADAAELIASRIEGGLHGLVNNAYSGPAGGIWEQGVEDYLEALNSSVGGAVRLLHAFRFLLEEAGSSAGASIVNVSSMYGIVSPDPELYAEGFEEFHNPPAYGVAKAGLLQWTRYCAVHLAKQGIRSNALAPGPFPSEKVQKAAPEFVQRLEKKVPMGRIGQPDDLSGAVAFLIARESRYLNGVTLPVDGGWVSQ